MKKISFAAMTLVLCSMNIHAANETKRPDMSQLCKGKAVNSKASVKMGDNVRQGTCQLGFKPNQQQALGREAMRDAAIQKACVGKAKGAAVSVKFNGKTVPGKCDIVFRPNMRA